MKTALTSRYTSYLNASAIGLTIAFTASLAHAQFFVRGEFNGWEPTFLMSDEGAGLHTYQATGLNPGETYFFKIANEDWSISWPGSDARVMADANGEVLFRAFDSTTWADGWLPDNARRVGYGYSGAAPHGWELIGSMNDWGGEALTDMGNGLYRGEVFLEAGDYDYKFRMSESWDINVGTDFGNSAGDIGLNVPTSAMYAFELDVFNGRHDVTVIPEPTTYAILFGLGALGFALYRRRQASTS